MKGDFSRDTFDAKKNFSRVLMQQGRVQLDADWNEQTSILLHYIRTLAADLIGPYGGPAGQTGFEITFDPSKKNVLNIGEGHFYVHGLLVENNDPARTYDNQPYYPLTADEKKKLDFSKGTWFVYLDVWERHVTYLDDDAIREVALGGPDTATRAQVVWQVRLLEAQAGSNLSPAERKKLEAQLAAARKERDQLMADLKAAQEKGDTQKQAEIEAKLKEVDAAIRKLQQQLGTVACDGVDDWTATGQTRLRARVKPEDVTPDPCITAPDSKYRGAENQLYRVEVHDVIVDDGGAFKYFTFKWSRDNGSIMTRIIDNNGKELVVQRARGFEAGQWVELSNDTQEWRGERGVLVKIAKVEGDVITIEPSQNSDTSQATRIRGWNQTKVGDIIWDDGVIQGETGKWFELEDGVQVQFEAGSDFRPGDYWLIPARVATGAIEWPWQTDANGEIVLDANKQPIPAWQAPHGVEHYYAPLGTLQDGQFTNCRCTFGVTLNC